MKGINSHLVEQQGGEKKFKPMCVEKMAWLEGELAKDSFEYGDITVIVFDSNTGMDTALRFLVTKTPVNLMPGVWDRRM